MATRDIVVQSVHRQANIFITATASRAIALDLSGQRITKGYGICRLWNLQGKIDGQKDSNHSENNTEKDCRQPKMLSDFNLCV